MAKEKPPEPPMDDIPAWFMTYSDVITLLMTFFILLLTFATTEPEKFDQARVSSFGRSSASGVAGKIHKGLDMRSWVERVRPRAARIAMQGSEMPPLIEYPAASPAGRGLKAPDDKESKKDVMTTNSFQVRLDPFVNSNANLTPKGVQMARMIANQLRALPVHCAIEFSDVELSDRTTRFLTHLYDVEKVRPGQVGVGYSESVDSDSIRFVIERFEQR